MTHDILWVTQKGEANLMVSVHDVVDGMNVNEDLVITLDSDICLGLRVRSLKVGCSGRRPQ